MTAPCAVPDMRGFSDDERRSLGQLALGRIFRIMSRPFRPGDVEEFERCRAIFMAAVGDLPCSWEANLARDHNRGAAGQW